MPAPRDIDNFQPHPFVKWAGGKRQLLPEIEARLPQSYGAYFEPFVGGGALFFELAPAVSHLNDINSSLINAYISVKEAPDEVIAELNKLDSGMGVDIKTYYYEQREIYNNMLLSGEKGPRSAAMLIFINKHCFNGLYRVNAQGLFNVPYNGSSAASFCEDNIHAVSKALSSATVSNGDFETACATAQKGDFVFFDSPYAPLNPTSFESYTKEGFSREEHVRLANLYKELTNRGCFCMLTNHDTALIRDLYKDFTIEAVSVRRSINSDASKRTGTEVIIRNY